VTAFYFSLWPVGASSVIIAIAGMTTLVQDRRRWLVLSIATTLAGALLYAPSVLAEAADPVHNRLHRDVAGAFIFAIAIPLIVSRLSSILARHSVGATTRLLAALGTAFLCLLASPLYFLFVHCTSGDCL